MSPEASVNVTALQKLVAQNGSSVSQFNTELVRNAFHALQRRRREANRAARVAARDFDDGDLTVAEDPLAYCWIEQLWTDHLIVKIEDGQGDYIRIPYTVDSPGTAADNVKFGAPEKVRVEYVAASNGEDALAQILEWRLANTPPQFLKNKKDSGSDSGSGGGKPSGTQQKRDGGNSGKGTGSANAQPKIKSLAELDSAIKAFGQAKDKAKYKGQLLSAARKLNASDGVIKRIQALSAPSGSGSGSGGKKAPNFRSSTAPKGSVAASAADSVRDIVALATVRTMEGARRYRKPIGSQLGQGGSGAAAPAGAGGGKDAPDSKSAPAQKPAPKGAVFGSISSETRLKAVLGQIERLPDAKRGQAAAEVVKAAQALGLTALVPTSVKRLYRQWISQSKIASPSKPNDAKAAK